MLLKSGPQTLRARLVGAAVSPDNNYVFCLVL